MSTVPDAVPTDLVLTEHHQQLLERSAVDVGVFLETGGRSIRSADELPEQFAYCSRQVPGVLFVHQRFDGSRALQYRPDDDVRADPDNKYVQETGSGSVVSVHPRMRGRVGAAERLVVVEGTKQYLAAVSYAADGDLIVGVQGCANWSRDGVPLGDLDALAAGVESAVVVFDADVRAKRPVWEAASKLAKHLEVVGGAGMAVRFASLPAGGSAGLDDYLAERPADSRARAFETLLALASTLGRAPARKPADKRIVSGPTVDWTAGLVRGPAREIDGVAVPGEALIDCAVKVAETRQFVDDLNADPRRGAGALGVEHDLLVAWGTGEDRVEHAVNAVADGDLRDPRKWLARTPGGAGLSRDWNAHPATQAAIEQAIRAYARDERRYRRAFVRTGLVEGTDGRVLTLHPGGAIGARGETHEAVAVLDAPYFLIGFPDPSAFSPQQLIADIAASFEPLDLLVDPTAWILLNGAAAYAWTGAQLRSVPAIKGRGGSGKSTVVRTFNSRLSPVLVERDLVSAHGSANSLGDVGIGLHQQVLCVDDLLKANVRPETRAAQIEQLEVLGRRGYGGGSAGRDRLKVNRSGVGRSIQREAADASSPCLVLVGETMPSAGEARTLVERLLVATVTRDSTMRTAEDTTRMRELGASGAMNRATSSFIAWLMGSADQAGGIKAWLARVTAKRAALEAALAEKFPELAEPRQREVPAPILVGWGLLVDHAVEVGAMTAERGAELMALAYERITGLAVAYGATELGEGTTPAESLVDRLRQAIASGRATLGDPQIGCPSIGRWDLTTAKTGAARLVAIYPEAAAQVLGRGATAEYVSTTLRSIDGAFTHPVRLEGATVRCAMVPLTTWEPPDTERADEVLEF